MATPPSLYSLPGFHDPVSSMSHLLGAGFFFFLGVFLLRRGCRTWSHSGFLVVYVISTVLLMSVSGVYHMLPRGETSREVMECLDRDAIFILIAGTFTPIHGIVFRGWRRWGVLFGVWSAAITAITLTSVFYGEMPEWVGGLLYLGLGWCGLISMVLLARRYGVSFIHNLLLGGVVYSVGAAIDFAGEPTLIDGWVQSHEVFHLAILLAAFLHWLFILKCATTEELCEWEPASADAARGGRADDAEAE
jgi:channel protein (hemolysin III family)